MQPMAAERETLKLMGLGLRDQQRYLVANSRLLKAENVTIDIGLTYKLRAMSKIKRPVHTCRSMMKHIYCTKLKKTQREGNYIGKRKITSECTHT